MTERLRKILRGGKLTPVTADEQAVKIAVDNAGGGGDEYETVAELAIGTMTQGGGEGLPATWWYDQVDTVPFAMNEGETYYLNDGDHPSDSVVIIPNTATKVLFNCKVEDNTIVPIAEAEPSYIFIDDGNDYTGVCCSDNISHNTVKILKKVSGSGSITVDDKIQADSTNPVENGAIYDEFEDVYAKIQRATPLIVHGTVDMVNGTAAITDDITIADIVAAFTADRAVFFQASLGEGYYVRLGLFQAIGNELTFSVSDISSNAATVYTCEFDNSTTGTFNHVG